jgi:hypothetical protein
MMVKCFLVRSATTSASAKACCCWDMEWRP